MVRSTKIALFGGSSRNRNNLKLQARKLKLESFMVPERNGVSVLVCTTCGNMGAAIPARICLNPQCVTYPQENSDPFLTISDMFRATLKRLPWDFIDAKIKKKYKTWNPPRMPTMLKGAADEHGRDDYWKCVFCSNANKGNLTSYGCTKCTKCTRFPSVCFDATIPKLPPPEEPIPRMKTRSANAPRRSCRHKK
jgi:hypothetical protein